jgi:hypothetical protein
MNKEEIDQLYNDIKQQWDLHNQDSPKFFATQNAVPMMHLIEGMKVEMELLRTECEGLRQDAERTQTAVNIAYGILWCVNEEPCAPVPHFSPQKAVTVARKTLLDVMDKTQQTIGIEFARKIVKETADRSQPKGDV